MFDQFNINMRVTLVFCVSEEGSYLIVEGVKQKLQEVRRSGVAGGFQYHISLLRTIETDQNKEK